MSSYQVIIPAAGSSRRMSELTTEQPKSLLEIGGNTVIGHSLDALERRGFRRVTFVVGYLRERFRDTLGDRYRGIDLEYVVSEDYATTEHGWSLFLTRESWERHRSPVLFMDADNVYDPRLLDRVLQAPAANVVLVDEGFETSEREEELVLGESGRVTGLKRALVRDEPTCVGGFLGINRFSPAFMAELYAYMAEFFPVHGRQFKYERLFDRLVRERGVALAYQPSGGLAWININHAADYRAAECLIRDIRDRREAPNAQ